MASRSLGTLTLDLIAKIGGFEQGLTKAERVANQRMTAIERRAQAFGRAIGVSIRNAAGNFAGLAAGFVSVQAVFNGFQGAVDAADKLNDFNVRLGASAEALSGWSYAAQQSGTDIETLGKSLLRLQKAISQALDPKSTEAKLFAALGVDVIDPVTKQLRTLEQVLPEVADGFKSLTNEALETQAATILLGKSGGELDEFLNLGADGLDAMRTKARELGIELSEGTLKSADEFNDTLGDLKAASQGLFTQLAAELLPELKALTQDLIQLVKDGRQAGEIAKALGNSLDFLGGIASAAGNRIGGLGQIIEGITAGFVELNGAAMAMMGGDFKRAVDIIRGSDSDALIGLGLNRLVTGAEDVKQEADAAKAALDSATESARLFDQMLRPLEKAGSVDSAVASVFAPEGSKAKKSRTGKSDAEKEAESLAKAYENTNERLKEQIALFGKEGEAAALRYELEFGALAKLEPLKKAELIQRAESLDLMRDEAEVAKEIQKEHDARVKQSEEVLQDIEAEREALGMSADQWEVYNNVKRAGANASKETIAAITASTEALQQERKAMEPQIAIMDDFRASLEDTVVDVVNGNKSISDAFKDLFDDLAAQITRWIARRLIEQAFGAPGTTGAGSSGGGWISGFLGMIFGGGRAAGGQVMPGQMYRVNENWNRGPEMLSMGGRDYLMMGSQAGRVSPAGSGGGTTFGPTIINVQGSATNATIRQIDRANARRQIREARRT